MLAPRRADRLRKTIHSPLRSTTMIRSTTSRREFLETIGGVGAVAAGTLSTLESARGYAANDTLEVACLGTGGRCRTLMKSLAEVPGVRIAAVCDIYDAHLERGEEAGRSQGRRDQALSRAARPQGHRRRPDRQPRPLARADGRRRLQRRQGRLRREAADPRPGRRARRSSTPRTGTRRSSRSACSSGACRTSRRRAS